MHTFRYKGERSQKGTLLVLSAGLYLVFVGIGLPMLIMASLFTRTFFLYQATTDSCRKAACASTFSDAQKTATHDFNRKKAIWKGISGAPSFSVLVKPLGPGPIKVKAAPLPEGSVQKSENVYLARVIVNGQVEPLISLNAGWQGMNIPFLTQPYPLTFSHVARFENPSGLTE